MDNREQSRAPRNDNPEHTRTGMSTDHSAQLRNMTVHNGRNPLSKLVSEISRLLGRPEMMNRQVNRPFVGIRRSNVNQP